MSELRGRPVILAFYPADWSPVCGDQMALYNEVLPEFAAPAQTCSASRSTAPGVTRRSRETRNLHFPLLSDFEPKGAVARAYGAYRDEDGRRERALFVIDGDGHHPLELRLARSASIPAPTAFSGARSAGEQGARLDAQAAAARQRGRSRAGSSEARRHARRVRRLRVPVLRRGVSRSSSGCRKQLGKRLRFVFRNFPLAEAHPHAENAAEAAEAAAARADSGRCTTLFENQHALEDADLVGTRARSAWTRPGSSRSWLERPPTRVRRDFTAACAAA